MKYYYVYVLESLTDGDWYTGYTENVRKRLDEHNSGKNNSTKNRRPFKLIYFEAGLNQQDALAREKYLKSGMGKRYLRNRLKNYINNADF
jgi:putative endonuclease